MTVRCYSGCIRSSTCRLSPRRKRHGVSLTIAVQRRPASFDHLLGRATSGAKGSIRDHAASLGLRLARLAAARASSGLQCPRRSLPRTAAPISPVTGRTSCSLAHSRHHSSLRRNRVARKPNSPFTTHQSNKVTQQWSPRRRQGPQVRCSNDVSTWIRACTGMT